MTTIYEAILSAEYNLTHNGQLGAMIAHDQLVNVVAALEKGKGLDDDIFDGGESRDN